MRKIVLVRRQEDLASSWIAASERQPVAKPSIVDELTKSGATVLKTVPVPVYNRGAAREAQVLSVQALASSTTDGYAVSVELSEGSIKDVLAHPAVIDVFADPKIEAVPVYCGQPAIGSFNTVHGRSGARGLCEIGLSGDGVHVAIIDTGIAGGHPGPWGNTIASNIDGSIRIPQTYTPGSTAPNHGTMCAFDVLIAAPQAKIIDVPLLSVAENGGWTAFLFDALEMYAKLLELRKQTPSMSLVISNSWGMFDTSGDARAGDPQNYGLNPKHPFNTMVGTIVAAGVDVVFAAGNCGGDCPDVRCPAGDRGPNHSIHGANSHPSVICVAAVTTGDVRLGYSSQGPGDLDPQKPDIAAYSHFQGSGVEPVDSGTSAACPVAAGIIAALRQRFTSVAPQTLRSALRGGARQQGAGLWNGDLGFGILDAMAAYNELVGAPQMTSPPRSVAPVKRAPVARLTLGPAAYDGRRTAADGPSLDRSDAAAHGALVEAVYSAFGANPSNLQPDVSLPAGWRLRSHVQMSDFFGGSTTPLFFGIIAEATEGPRAGELVLAIRGTATGLEWFDNAHIGLVRFGRAPGLVAYGFSTIYRTLRLVGRGPGPQDVFDLTAAARDAVIGAVSESTLADDVKALFAGRAAGANGVVPTITVVGHSLGAALATLYVADAVANEKANVKALYTFASPRVGDETFTNALVNKVSCPLWRIENRWDVVPKLPFSMLGYRDVGTDVPLDSTGSARGTLGCFHSLSTYLALLDGSYRVAPACRVGPVDASMTTQAAAFSAMSDVTSDVAFTPI